MKTFGIKYLLMLCLGFLFTAAPAYAQRILYVSDDPVYIANVDSGNSLYEKGEYTKAIPYFEKALKISRKSVRTGFRTARCILPPILTTKCRDVDHLI